MICPVVSTRTPPDVILTKACWMMRTARQGANVTGPNELLDDSANKYNLLCNPLTRLAAGIGGYDLSLRGGSIEYAYNNSLNVGGGISTSESFWWHAWMEIYNSTQTAYSTIGFDGFGVGWGFFLQMTSTAVAAACVATSGGAAQFTATKTMPVLANRWYCISAYFGHNSIVKIYVDGVLGASTSITKTTWRTSTIGIVHGAEPATGAATPGGRGITGLSTGAASSTHDGEVAAFYNATRKFYYPEPDVPCDGSLFRGVTGRLKRVGSRRG